MTQLRFSEASIHHILDDFGVSWQQCKRWDEEWEANLGCAIYYLNQWCAGIGITAYAIGFTQIELCVTFQHKRDAMLFKLRWHHARDDGQV